MIVAIGVFVPLCVGEKLHVCKVGGVDVSCCKHFGHVRDHGFIVNVKRTCMIVDPLENFQMRWICGRLKFW